MGKVAEVSRLIRQARKSLGLNGEAQQTLLRRFREAFDLQNEELAEALGVPLNTLIAYLAPESARKSRTMPEADRLVLARVLATRRGKNAGARHASQ